MAEAWLVLTLTHSGAAVGATFAFRFAPVLFFGLWGGAIADRYDRRTVLLLDAGAGRAAGGRLWLVVLFDVVQVWMVFGLAFAVGMVTVVEQPAHHAFVEEMVGRDKLANAVALNSAVLNSARISGPAIAGLLIAAASVAWVFFVNAVSYVAVVIALGAMRRAELRPLHHQGERPRVREGLRVRVEHHRDPGDDRPRRRGGHARLQLPHVPHAHGAGDVPWRRRAGRPADGGARRRDGVRRALRRAPGAAELAHRGGGRGRARRWGWSGWARLPSKALVFVALVPVGALAVFFGSTANAHMQMWSRPSTAGG